MVIDWLKAQHKAMGDTVEGIFILDDIVGFINEEHYLEFAHPYLKRICDAFPEDWVKLYHNDAEVDACLDHLPDAGFNVLNWGKQKRHPRSEAARGRSHVPDGQRESAGNRACAARPRKCGKRRSTCWKAPAARASFFRWAAASVPACRAQNIVAMLESAGGIQRRAARGRRRGAAMVDYALMNQCLYEGKAKEVEQMTKDALAEGRRVRKS